MTTLVLISCFTAFFIVLFERFIHLGVMKIAVSVVFSVTGCVLLGGLSIKEYPVYIGASCFLSPFLALSSDKLSKFTKAVVTPLRRNP
jgi:hypothetical protein